MLFNLSLLKKTIALLSIFTGTLLVTDVGNAASSSTEKQDASAKQEVTHKKDKTDTEKSIANAKKSLLGKHYKELEFIGVASLVGLGILTPELFRRKKTHSNKESDRQSIEHLTPIQEKNSTPGATKLKVEKEPNLAEPVKVLPHSNNVTFNVVNIDPELQHRFSSNPSPQENKLKFFEKRSVVLIVDDSLMVREMLSETFMRVGYKIELACDGQEAWEKLSAGLSYDLILCDIEMPRMNGLELLSLIQQDKKLSAIPFAVLTSFTDRKIREQAIALGAKGYFLKPHMETVLIESAERLIAGDFLLGKTAA
jgi:CheY-like chemotaxis protein